MKTFGVKELAAFALAGIAAFGIVGCTPSEQAAPTAEPSTSFSEEFIDAQGDLEEALYGRSIQDGVDHVVVIEPDGSATYLTMACEPADSRAVSIDAGALEGDTITLLRGGKKHFETTETGFRIDAQEFTHADSESTVCA